MINELLDRILISVSHPFMKPRSAQPAQNRQSAFPAGAPGKQALHPIPPEGIPFLKRPSDFHGGPPPFRFLLLLLLYIPAPHVRFATHLFVGPNSYIPYYEPSSKKKQAFF